jgi:hypothetical protein
MTTSRKRAAKDSLPNSEFLIKMHNDNINAAVTMLLEKSQTNNGRLPHNEMNKVISDLQTLGVVTDRDRLNYLMSKRLKKAPSTNDNNNFPPDQVNLNVDSVASTITFSSNLGLF